MAIDESQLTDYEQQLLLDPELRQQRRQAKLARLGWSIVYLADGRPRGKKRAGWQDTLPTPTPPFIEPAVIRRLGKLLKVQEKPLMDDITDNHHPSPDKESYELYVTAGNKHNKRIGTTPQEKREIRAAKMRQTQHIADQLHHVARTQLQLASIRRAALSAAQRSFRTVRPLSDEAALWAAEAIEDFGQCLKARPDITDRLGYDKDIATEITHVGLYGSYEPHSVLANGDLLRLVQIEQAKREEFWGARYDGYVEVDRDRTTVVDHQRSLEVEQLIVHLTPAGVVQ